MPQSSVFHTYEVHRIFSRFPIPDSRFPIPDSLFPKIQKLFTS
ncbi:MULTISPECIES: hypothetical protein [unclassified Moorena]|nr:MULTISPECIES: hypothetical protein [unclassified Moorena]